MVFLLNTYELQSDLLSQEGQTKTVRFSHLDNSTNGGCKDICSLHGLRDRIKSEVNSIVLLGKVVAGYAL
jgi:hypothetical protein